MNKTKFISAALLLVAGTAFANAASVVVSMGYPSGTDYFTRNDFKAHKIDLDALDSTLSGYYDLSKISYLKGSESNNFADYLAIVDSDYSILGISLQESTSRGSFGSSANKALANYSFDTAVTLSASSDYYVIFLSGTTDLEIGGKFDTSEKQNLVANIGSGDGGTLCLADEASVAKNANPYTVSFTDNAMTLTEYKVDSNSVGVTYQVTIEQSAVPEPSAFGLLAGLGALALVASRRRRSRKA